jgi:hypothetical protein
LRSNGRTVPPVGQVVLPDKESINGRKAIICKSSTTRADQAWKQVYDEDGELINYRCPKCITGIIRYRRIPGNLKPIAECDNDRCSWTVAQMTPAQRAELEKVDPDTLRVAEYEEKITGKERRMKQFLSKAAF